MPSRQARQSCPARWIPSLLKQSSLNRRLVGILAVLGVMAAAFTARRQARLSVLEVHDELLIPESGPELNSTLLQSDDEPSQGRQQQQQLRVAVCFFGLARSLRWTIPSIKTRLLDVLREAGMEVDIFLHTYDLEEVNNARAGEIKVGYAQFSADYEILNATRSMVTNQDEFDLLWPDPMSLSHFHWTWTGDAGSAVIRNVFRAYWSLSTVSSMMELYSLEKGFWYDAVVLARPDVWFHADTDLPSQEFPLPEKTVFIPSFETDLHVMGRKNDRFAYGSPTAMKVLMNRIPTFVNPDPSDSKPRIDSEGVLGYHLQAHEISVKTVEFSLSRVRLTGDIPMYDHGRVEEACESGGDPMACEMVQLGFKFPVENVTAEASV